MLIGLILLALALTELWLGLYFIFRYEKQQSTIWYGLFFIGASVYVGANGLGYLGRFFAPGGLEQLAWSGGVLATSFFLPFSFSYPLPSRSFRDAVPWVIWPLLVFIPALLRTDLFIGTEGVRFGEGYMTDQGPYFFVLILFIFFYWGWSLYNIVKSFGVSDGIHRLVLKIVLFGVCSSFVVTVIFDIIIPLVTVTRFGYVGSLFTSVWVLLTGYILVKK